MAKASKQVIAGALAVASASGAGAQPICGLIRAYDQQVKQDNQSIVRRIWKSADGSVLAFRSPLAVNTDGNAKSYVALHKFPSMSNLPARFNVICNGVSVTPSGGSKVSAQTTGGCDIINRVVVQMGTKAAPWVKGSADPLIDWYAIATTRDGSVVRPCMSGDHYVSMTSAASRPRRADSGPWGPCDQARWLDAATIPAIVIPKQSRFLSDHQVDSGDAVVLYMPPAAGAPERFAYAIVGDLGPANKLGEATLAAHAQLRGVPVLDPESIKTKAVVKEIARFAAKGAIVSVVLPRTRPSDAILDNADANASRAQSAFATRFGNGQIEAAKARLRNCEDSL